MTLFGVAVVTMEVFVSTTLMLAGLLVAVGYQYYSVTGDGEFEDAGDSVDLPKPNIRRSWFGPLAAYWHLRKERKLAGKGYVKWFLVDDGWPRPKYIKPTDKGGGEFEYEHDGETYLFPREAMLPSRDEGMWTVMHDKGDAKPRNLRQPDEPSVSAKQLNNYVTSRVTVEPPGWLENLNIDASDLLTYGVIGFILIILLQGVLKGGVM